MTETISFSKDYLVNKNIEIKKLGPRAAILKYSINSELPKYEEKNVLIFTDKNELWRGQGYGFPLKKITTNVTIIEDGDGDDEPENQETDEITQQALKKHIENKDDTAQHIIKQNNNYYLPDGTKLTGGIDGKSAYEIAVENGFEGTEKEWLESLKNCTGGPLLISFDIDLSTGILYQYLYSENNNIEFKLNEELGTLEVLQKNQIKCSLY